MKNNYFFSIALIILAVFAFLSGNLLLIIGGLVFIGIALYSLKPAQKSSQYERESVYKAPGNKKPKNEYVYAKLPIQSLRKGEGARVDTQIFEIIDKETGEKKVYHSIDEMPPNIRQQYEKSKKDLSDIMNSAGTESTITMTGNDGIERTFKSFVICLLR